MHCSLCARACCFWNSSPTSMQVGEALPVRDETMDAVIGTLVLCSVKDVNMALQGIYNNVYVVT